MAQGEIGARGLQLSRSNDHVLVDRVQVQQVVVNLLRNATENMEGCPRRELTVSTAPVPGLIAVVLPTLVQE